MLKWLAGGGGGNGNGGGSASGNGSDQIGRVFRINEHQVVVEDTLAEGGFAIVFVVKTPNGRKLALKRLAVNNEQDLRLAKQEIAITKALSDSPFSVTYISSFVRRISSDVHEVLILMELYTGTSVIDLLNRHLSAGTKLSEAHVLHIFSDVTRAVARLHHRTKPIIHRDLKIENVLHDARVNCYVLCDYGSSSVKSMHPEEMGASNCSDEISRFTTMAYRSPEMVSVFSGKTITTKSDIWALGVLLFKLCFMDTPFSENPLAIVSAQYNIPENSPYSEELHNLIGYLLTPDPDQRPTIWQVCEVVARLRRTPNPVPNVFTSSRPPNPLPSPKKTKISPSKKQTNQSNPFLTVTPSNHPRVNALTVTTTTISSRDRPRARGQESPQSSRKPANKLKPMYQNPGMHKSVDSGLDAFGHVPFTQERAGSETNLVTAAVSRSHQPVDQFGSAPFCDRFSTPPPSVTAAGTARRDLFGAPPFTGSQGAKITANVDPFGAVPFN